MNDEDIFVKKVCTLIEDEKMRKSMGLAALRESEQYKIEIIVQRWMVLFQKLIEKKRGR